MNVPIRNAVTAVSFVALVLVASPAAATSGCSGSGPEAICASIAHDETWMYLTLDCMTVMVAGAAQGITFGPNPPGFPVHPLNLFSFPMSAMTIGAGLAGWNKAGYMGISRFTLGLGVASAMLAVLDTVVIAGRYRKARRSVRISAAGVSGRF